MIKKWIALALSCLLITAANAPLVSGQTEKVNDASAIAKIKADVLKRGTGEKNRVKVKMLNGTKLKGYINQVDEDSFSLTNSERGQITSIAYRDVAKVEKSGLSKGTKIGLTVGIVGGIAAVVLAVFFRRYCNEQAC